MLFEIVRSYQETFANFGAPSFIRQSTTLSKHPSANGVNLFLIFFSRLFLQIFQVRSPSERFHAGCTSGLHVIPQCYVNLRGGMVVFRRQASPLGFAKLCPQGHLIDPPRHLRSVPISRRLHLSYPYQIQSNFSASVAISAKMLTQTEGGVKF
jgi:hypothetical protein